MRPLCTADFGRGFLEVMRVAGRVGYVSQRRWEERCEYLRGRGERGEEFVVVVVQREGDRVVGAGRWVGERGFMHSLATVGRIEDLSVARDCKGMKMGLRLLEALVGVSMEMGCIKVGVWAVLLSGWGNAN